MKKYLSLFLICLSLLLVSCGQGKPKDFDIKLDSVDPEDLVEDIEEMFEELEENPISGNASWYNVNISGYYNSEQEVLDETITSNTKYLIHVDLENQRTNIYNGSKNIWKLLIKSN